MRAIDVLNKCQQHRSLQSCLFDFNLNAELVKYKTRIHLGFYAVFLREWLSVFPQSLKEIELTKFKITTSKREYVTKHKLGKQPMMAETRVLLENLYRPDTEELSRLLKDKRFLWISRDNKRGITENFTINKI